MFYKQVIIYTIFSRESTFLSKADKSALCVVRLGMENRSKSELEHCLVLTTPELSCLQTVYVKQVLPRGPEQN